MGCDIHTMMERKTRYDFWVAAGEIDQDRNYDLFSVLAGVRGQREPIKSPEESQERFIEENNFAYATTSFIKEFGSDGHTYGFYTLDELESYRQPTDIEWRSRSKPEWERMIAELENVRLFYKLSQEAVRLVFFFDN